MLSQILIELAKRFIRLKNHEQRYDGKREMQSGIFLDDEFAALRNCIGQKEFTEINDSFKKNYIDGQSCKSIHIIMALQRPTSVDGRLEIIISKDWFRKSKDENFKMVFGI